MEYFFSIFFGTFLLEDVALVLALGLVADGKMEFWPAFLACFLGISVGDMGLYVLGFFVGKLDLEKHFKSIKKFRATLVNDEKSKLLTYSIIISRFIPGTRIPTYLVSGILRYPLFKFFILTVVTVLGWVAVAFAVGSSLKSILMSHLLVTVVLALMILSFIKTYIPKLSNHWERKALLHSWRGYLYFEFWPSLLFYLPLVPYVPFLMAKYRSLFAFFYANPEIDNGGLIGESKWDFLKHMDKNSPYMLKCIKIPKQNDFTKARKLLDQEGFNYPFILKPDVGQRGFAVRIIRDDFDLTEYLLLADFDMIVQELSYLPNEAGIFYIRNPREKIGSIFSITDKKFPFIYGDGKTKLGDLILKDQRARIIASTYYARHREHLDDIIANGEMVQLSECGNHCQGAIFYNGESLKTPELEKAIHELAIQIPNFYFGRFDIRYKSTSDLKNGKNFEIVEVNGAGSEATHIWDAKTSLFEAYRTLFKQWDLLFKTGKTVQEEGLNKKKVRIIRLLLECYRVYFRKEPLSVSS